MGYIYDEIKRRNADGIDFVPIWVGEGMPPVICSYTREEFKNIEKEGFPKSNWECWKIIDGKKVYI